LSPPLLVRTALLALAGASAGCLALGEGEDAHALPAFERERPVAGAPREWDLGWPFGHGTAETGRATAGARPLWRSVRTDRRDRLEVLYPLYRSEEESDGAVSTRLFPLYWHDRLPFADGIDSDTAILPFLFWGNEPGEGGYFCLFPVGGVLHHKVLSDRVTFVLFPLYAGTRSGAWRGHHLAWPLVHWGSDGEGRRAFRFLPFWSRHRKEGVFDRVAVLWPIFHWSEENQDRPVASTGWMVWPLYGREEARDGQTSTTLLWPLFHWADGPRARERSLPFPIWRERQEWSVQEDGSRVLASELRWIWPFWGRFDRGEEEHSGFVLWPLGHWWDDASAGGRAEGVVVAPFWWSQAFRPDGGGPGDASWKLWPLAQGARRSDGASEWSALAPLPWFRWEELEANWGVFWELVRVREGPDGSRAVDLLFSLVRSRRSPEGERHRIPLLAAASRDAGGSRWSLLEGLIGGETDARGASSLRLLWLLRIPLGGGR
jgi:hypothetical protein